MLARPSLLWYNCGMYILALIRRLKMTPFEKAYIDLYNGCTTLDGFIARCGIDNPDKARRELNRYRHKILRGEIKDPREKYGY